MRTRSRAILPNLRRSEVLPDLVPPGAGVRGCIEIGPVLAAVGTQPALDYPPDLSRIAPSQKMRVTLSLSPGPDLLFGSSA